MRKNIVLSSIFLVICLFAVSGCYEKSLAVLEAEYTAAPVKIDGKLDDAIWQKAAVYQMNVSVDKGKKGISLTEPGQIQLAWDEEYFYLAASFVDSDIVAQGDKDELHHYSLGDVCELFLKPADKTWYWELYVSPLGNKTTFWFPSQGRLGLPSNFKDYKSDLIVAADNAGTVNDWADKDTRWTAEMAMPVKDLCARGETFGPGSDWRILIGRYNYSYYLKTRGAEFSMAPKLSATNYHFIDEYARLVLVGSQCTTGKSK